MALPKLPYGQGSMSVRKDGKIMYKKSINGKRYCVYADSAKDAMKKMRQLELELERKKIQDATSTLEDGMMDWLKTYKKPSLKKTSYETLRKTIEGRICEYSICKYRVEDIDSNMLQKHINMLNEEKHYSYSIIKKCYDALNAYYKHLDEINNTNLNPMKVVKMPNKDNVKPIKELQFFDEDDIERFVEEANVLEIKNRVPKYKCGLVCAANLFVGMRGGELLGLKIGDLNFENNTVYIHNNLQLVPNEDYDGTNSKQIYEIQSLKMHQTRTVHLNSIAVDLLKKHISFLKHTGKDDFVCQTKTGNHVTLDYLKKTIGRIEMAADTKIKYNGTHLMRHTCASLYFNAGVDVKIIAFQLGDTEETLRKTYIHLIEKQKLNASNLVSIPKIEQLLSK